MGDDEVELLKPVYCSISKCNNKSLCYCDTCKTTLCDKHKEIHDELLDGHSFIQLDQYQRNPVRYYEHVCPSHMTKLSLACESCDQIVCTECDLTGYCNEAGRQHRYRSLLRLIDTIEDDYQSSISEISDEILTNTSKATRYNLEECVAAYNEDETIGVVDRILEQRIAEIQARAEECKKQIREFPQVLAMAVTEYVYQLHEKERMLEELVKELKGLLRKRHICDIIRENQSIQKKIEEALSLTPGECDKLREMAVSQIGFIHDIEVELRPLYPKDLVKLSSSSMTKHPQCLSLTDRGDVLFYDQGCVKITSTIDLDRIKYYVKVNAVLSLAQWRDRVYVAVFKSKQFVCMFYNYELSKSSIVAQFPTLNPNSAYPQLAANDEALFIIDKVSQHGLRIYDHKGVHLRTMELPNKPNRIWALPGPYILVNDVNKRLAMYCISSSEAVCMHSLNIGSQCTTDPAGVIYSVANDQRQTNYLDIYNSSTGEVVHTIQLHEGNIYNLSVKDNMLVASDKANIHLYRLTY